MRSTPLLVEATPGDGCTVHVRFEDGTAADVDLSYLLDHGGVFEPLRDQRSSASSAPTRKPERSSGGYGLI